MQLKSCYYITKSDLDGVSNWSRNRIWCEGGEGGEGKKLWEASSRYPAKIDPNILIALLTPPPQECIELHVQERSDRSNVFPLMLPLSPWQSIHISGTSSKLGRNIAFHHCTLLLDVDEILLKSLLHPSYVSFF